MSKQVDCKCRRCDGCGKVWGSGGKETPLSEVVKLPYRNIAIGLALNPARACPDCKGSGVIVST